MLLQRVSGWQGNVYLERIVSEQVSSEHENFRDTVFFGSLYGDHSMNDDGFMDKLIASDYWTEKFIEWAGHSCYDEKSLDVVTKKFKAFLVSRCKSGMDIFCNDIDQIKSSAVNRIIRQLNQATNNSVFSSFLELMRCSPDKLFSAIETAKENVDADPQNGAYLFQYDFFKSNESKLREFFSQSQLLSSERKEEVTCFLSDNLKA